MHLYVRRGATMAKLLLLQRVESYLLRIRQNWLVFMLEIIVQDGPRLQPVCVWLRYVSFAFLISSCLLEYGYDCQSLKFLHIAQIIILGFIEPNMKAIIS